MWSQYPQELHPIELHELSLEELTGTRPSHKGTLMYLKQTGIPVDAIHFTDPGPQRGHLRNIVKAIEHNFYTGPVTRHPEVQPVLVRDSRARDIGGPPKSPVYQPRIAMSSRELMTGRRDGRAAALFRQMKDRSDQYVVDEATVPGHYQQDPYGQDYQDKRPWQKSPWDAANENALGLPDKAFESQVPKPKPKPKLQNPVVQKRGPPVYSQVDSIRQHQSAPPQQRSKPPQIGCTWKGEGKSMRFHSGVRPYEMNHNRTARGWSWSQQSDTAPGQGQAMDDTDGSWGGTGGRGYDDFNARPKSWIQEDQYSPRQQARPTRPGDVARHVVRNVVGQKTGWGGESDDL